MIRMMMAATIAIRTNNNNHDDDDDDDDKLFMYVKIEQFYMHKMEVNQLILEV